MDKQLKKLKGGDVIKLTWLDAFGKATWCDWSMVEIGFKDHVICEIVGHYVDHNEDFICLSMGHQSQADAMPFLHLEFIPVGCVKNIKKLK